MIVEREIGQNETDEAVIYPERRPYDECVTFVTRLLDEAAALMAATQPAGKLGRATSVAAKAIKARVLLYAASPLVNGNSEFYAGFKDKSGRHLIAQEYDPEKWGKARTAAQEAIALAEENGYKLYENPTGGGASRRRAGRDQLPRPVRRADVAPEPRIPVGLGRPDLHPKRAVPRRSAYRGPLQHVELQPLRRSDVRTGGDVLLEERASDGRRP